MRRVYLDWNATTPPLPEVLDTIRAVAEETWANPSSIHGHGRAASAAVEEARASVATLCGADPRDVIFTSGGTEANNLALTSAFPEAPEGEPPRLITTRLEHPSIARTAEALEAAGRARVRWVAVERDGTISLSDLEDALGEGAARLVTAQAVNHETGVIQPLDEIFARVGPVGIPVHLDAIQGWGKIAVRDGAATMSIAAHKIRGPKGIGALVRRRGTRVVPLLRGGAQEQGLRAGTLDPALCAGFGVAARHARGAVGNWEAVRPRRDAIEAELLALAERNGQPAQVVGALGRRAPHVSTLVWPGLVGAELVAALDLEGVSVSTGSACSAGTVEPSPIVTAILGKEVANAMVRISLGVETTADDVRFAVVAWAKVLTRQRPV